MSGCLFRSDIPTGRCMRSTARQNSAIVADTPSRRCLPTASRRSLVAAILREISGAGAEVPKEPEDLVELNRVISSRAQTYLALTHFDMAARRHTRYEVDLFTCLRNLAMEQRKLVLLIHSHQPFVTLLPRDHPMSDFDVKTIELIGRE